MTFLRIFSINYKQTSTAMKEYFKCNRCFMKIPESRIARHHSSSHADIPHDEYLDNYFDLGRPLFKCDCCSIKLSVKRLLKHRVRAHPNKDNSFKKYTLPLLQHMEAARLKLARSSVTPSTTVIELSSCSDSEEEEGEIIEKTKPSFIDATVQCDIPSQEGSQEPKSIGTNPDARERVNQSIGEKCETSDKAVNTENPKAKEKATQASMEPIQYKCSAESRLPFIEYDEDGFAELVFML